MQNCEIRVCGTYNNLHYPLKRLIHRRLKCVQKSVGNVDNVLVYGGCDILISTFDRVKCGKNGGSQRIAPRFSGEELRKIQKNFVQNHDLTDGGKTRRKKRRKSDNRK